MFDGYEEEMLKDSKNVCEVAENVGERLENPEGDENILMTTCIVHIML